jgi:hypothetical protein
MWDDLIGENLAANPVDQTRNLIDRIGIGSVPWDAQGQDLSGVIGSNADYQNKIANASVPAAAGNAFVVSPADRILNSVKSVDWNDQSWRGQYAGDYGGSDFSPYNGGSDFEMPATMQQYAPANALPLPDQSQYQSLGIGLTPEQSRDAMNATGFGVAKASAAAEAERGGAWGGIQGNPYFMGIRPQATNVLGYQGSFMGGSRGYTDDSAGQAWDQAANRNVEIQRMLGNQNIARQSNANELARFGIMSQDRQDAIKQRENAKTLDIINKTQPGDRIGMYGKAITDGALPYDIGMGMAADDAISRALRAKIKEGKLHDLDGFLRDIEPFVKDKWVTGDKVIDTLKKMGVEPSKLKGKGSFAESLLGPEVIVDKPWGRWPGQKVTMPNNSAYGGMK